jgi:phosphate transport system permease protein
MSQASTSQPVDLPRRPSPGGLRNSLRRLWAKSNDTCEPGIEWLIRICGWSAIFFVLAIFVFVLLEGAPALRELNLKEFFTSRDWRPTSQVREQYGILALLVGTLSVTAVAMAIAVPFGLGAAVYISEFSTGKTKETLKIVIEMLAAIPSVVWGFIGYMVMGPIIIKLTGAPVGVNLLNGGIILALMSVPVIVSVSEDALRAVPDSYREAALALGASKWEIVHRVLFPAAKSGLLAAVLLGVGRSIGETMAVLMCTGHSVNMPHSLLDPVRTLTATVAAELGEAVRGDTHYRVLFLIGIVLFVFVFIVNVTADLIVKGIRGRQND